MALFGQGDFTINQNTTPEMLRQKRARLAAMMPQYGKAEYIGQGLGQLFQGIGSGRSERRMDEYEGQRSKEATDQYNSAMNGFGSGGPLSVLGMAPSGTWTPDAPAPSPTDVPGATAGLRFGMNTPDVPAEGAGGLGFTPPPMTPQQMIVAGSEARGLNPIDVATAISYETGGTFDPMQTGPTTQYGQHQGFIQFGKPQAEQYGADFSNPQMAMNSQLDPKTGAVWNYLDGTGVKPGMGLDNIYSAINAGAPGRFNASDANNGGAPGTVADKVAGMGDHRTKATEFMGGTWTPAAGGNTPGLTVSTQGQPQGGDLQMLMQAASNPWLTPEQRGMVNGMIQQQQGRDNSMWEAQQKQSDPMYQAQLANEQAKAANGGAGGGEYGLTPQYGTNAAGELVLIQLGKDGTAKQTALPEGIALQKGVEKLDLGTSFQWYNTVTGAPIGEPIPKETAQEAADIARAKTTAENSANIDTGGAAAGAIDLGKASIDAGTKAWESYGKMQTSLANIDEAITALDGGAQSGMIYNMLPNITEASASLENAMNRMGLDVVGSVTFGALSEGEMRLAMATAVPQNLGPKELKDWLVRRRGAQAKAAAMTADAAQFLTVPGNTINDWIAKNRAAKAKTAPAQTPPAAPTQQPSAPTPMAAQQPTVTNDAEYDALPSGTVFTAPDGSTRRKP